MVDWGKKYNEVVAENVLLKEENGRLRRGYHALQKENEEIRCFNTRLLRKIEVLERRIEEMERASKKQACPFSKGEPKKNPKKPGQHEGHAPANRSIPSPEKIDRLVDVPLPERCDHCEGSLKDRNRPMEEAVHPQYVQDIEFKVTTTQFDVHSGTCPHCGRRVQGRHPEQMSDALGAAGVQLGPTAHALAMELKNRLGLSFGKVRYLYTRVFGLSISCGGLSLARNRHAMKLLPTYVRLIQFLQVSAVVYMDETGWRVNGRPAWLWVATNQWVTLYLVDPCRGHEVVQFIIGQTFKGTLVTDCFGAYDPVKVNKGKCAQHFLRAFENLSQNNPATALGFPTEASAIFTAAIRLKAEEAQYTPHGYTIACGRLEARLDRLLAGTYTNAGNHRLANRLIRHRDHLFTFLYKNEVHPTNNISEQRLKLGIQARKLSGCNRTDWGAAAYCFANSIIQTWRQKGIDFLESMKRVLRTRGPVLLDIPSS
ncbi:MAG: IS66 family transposase, partial [Planctomycetes bacterium]|nr:IS66 family transposase [Planctomycetota bacterium]